ncbi:hypothetical protein CPT03_02275 [Pedobacter ginsengisoli]|uniref:Transporter n=1 Tax=Pedobacter ginsengisoli TaxID=363852 RepID=A0A2D1U172_9SPHI|nr:TolC family protein [Pedobacter ginsengisoli]ATP55372.1 hypothetical protein CPT03_02275 [Pedobacter ginsengisoli]
MKILYKFVFLACFLISLQATCQTNWTLDSCINYALSHNLELEQSRIQESSTKLQSELQHAKKIPSLSISSNLGLSIGRSVDPTTNEFTNKGITYQSYGLQSNLMLFNWFNVRNSIKSVKYHYQSVSYEVENSKINLKLNLIVAYLSLLEAKKQVKLSNEAILLIHKQILKADSLIVYGRASRINSLKLKSQLAKDSSGLYRSRLNLSQTKLELKQLLNLNGKSEFDIIDSMNNTNDHFNYLLDILPERIVKDVQINHPLQRSSVLEVKSLEYKLKAASAMRMPSLNVNFNVGSNYSSNYKNMYTNSAGYFDQILNTNLSRSVLFSLSVPVFNQKSLDVNVKQAKINLHELELRNSIRSRDLEKLIYSAYNDAIANYKDYQQSLEYLKYSEEAYKLDKLLFENGRISAVELLESLNNLNIGKHNCSSLFYSTILKIMILKLYDNCNSL